MSNAMADLTTLAALNRAGSFFLLVAVVTAPSGCAEQAAPPSMDDVRAGSEPSQEGWSVQFVISEAASQTDESRPRVEIHADYMATFETPDSTYTEMQSGSERPILAYIFNEAGDTSAVLRSNRLILYEEERRFEALGNVVVETREEKILESEHLVWVEDDRLVRTPGFVRIQTPTESIQGYSLVADEDLDTYTLARVTGQVTVEDDEREETGDEREAGLEGQEETGEEADDRSDVDAENGEEGGTGGEGRDGEGTDEESGVTSPPELSPGEMGSESRDEESGPAEVRAGGRSTNGERQGGAHDDE